MPMSSRSSSDSLRKSSIVSVIIRTVCTGLWKDAVMPNPFTKDRNEIDAMEYVALGSHEEFSPESGLGVSKYRAALDQGSRLDALLVNQGSDALFVSCHGAFSRKEVTLPRFERLRTFLDTSYSSMFFGDPTLHLSDDLSLGWYTGWEDFDLYPVLADWVQRAAKAIGASKVIFLGSSGGGFASLQASAYVPGSVAVPLSAQTRLSRYTPLGNFGHQRNYVRRVMPHLLPPGGIKEIGEESDWDAPLGERASAVERYSRPQPNCVLYVQNRNDYEHYEQHYLPFRQAVESGPNLGRVKFHIYDGPERHTPPTGEQLDAILLEALDWSESNSAK